MTYRMPTPAETRRIVEQWSETGRMLAQLRRDALVAQTAEESRRAAWDMLQLGGMSPADPHRETSSGLIELQRLFSVLRSRDRS